MFRGGYLISFDAVSEHLKARFAAAMDAPRGVLAFSQALPASGRRQRISVQPVTAKDGTQYVAFSTPVAPLKVVDPLRCLQLNNRLVGVYLSASSSQDPFVLMITMLRLSTLELVQLDACIASLAQTADGLEAALTSGQDVF